jgi:hypothetical protein
MSVKFKEETVTQTVTDGVEKGKDIVKEVGEVLTQGAGPNGYLAVSLAHCLLER